MAACIVCVCGGGGAISHSAGSLIGWCHEMNIFLKASEVGSAIFLGGALSLECYLFFIHPLVLDRNNFKFASALSAIPL